MVRVNAATKEVCHSGRASRSNTTRFHPFPGFRLLDNQGRSEQNKLGPCRMNRFETKARLIRVLPENSICSTGLTLNLCGQFGKHFPELRSGMRDHNLSGSSFSVRPARCSANAWSARSASRSCDPTKSFSQRRSEASSSSKTRPNASCSASESFDASSNAFWSSFVMSTLSDKYIKNPFSNHLQEAPRLTLPRRLRGRDRQA